MANEIGDLLRPHLAQRVHVDKEVTGFLGQLFNLIAGEKRKTAILKLVLNIAKMIELPKLEYLGLREQATDVPLRYEQRRHHVENKITIVGRAAEHLSEPTVSRAELSDDQPFVAGERQSPHQHAPLAHRVREIGGNETAFAPDAIGVSDLRLFQLRQNAAASVPLTYSHSNPTLTR